MLKRVLAFMVVVLVIVSFSCRAKEEVAVKKVEGTTVACIAEQGAYEEMGTVLGELYMWLAGKEIAPAGPPIGVYYDNPEEVPSESLRYEICVPVAVEIEGDERVGVRELPATDVAYITHKGSYANAGLSWEKVYAWIETSEYVPTGPGREVYLNSPQEVPEDSLLTEIQIPVTKEE